jgi:hypothetical protein
MTADRGDVGRVTIDVLPDGVLLQWIYSVFVWIEPYKNLGIVSFIGQRCGQLEACCTRVEDSETLFSNDHVAWISKSLCTTGKPVREVVNIWPALPLAVWVGFGPSRRRGMDEIFVVVDNVAQVAR